VSTATTVGTFFVYCIKVNQMDMNEELQEFIDNDDPMMDLIELVDQEQKFNMEEYLNAHIDY